MRTTFNTVNRHTQNVITKKYSELASLQKQIATGTKLTRPSDDPIAVSNVLGLRSNNNALKQFSKNISDGLSWMEITDTTMNSMNTILQSGRELAIKGNSDTLSPNERKYLAEEVEQLTRQLISLSNSKFKGDYLFSGSHTDLPPVPIAESSAKNSFSYTGFEMGYFDGSGAAVGSTFQLWDPNGISEPSQSEQVKDIIPGSFTLKIGAVGSSSPQELKEGEDYSVDYLKGTITILSDGTDPDKGNAVAALGRDFTPGSGNYGNGTTANNIMMDFEYASESKNIYNQSINTNSRILREIESGVTVEINTSVDDFTVDNTTNAITSMIKLGSSLLASDSVGIQDSMDKIDVSFNKILSAQSENGSKVNLFFTSRDRNEMQQVETTRIQSELEDADYSEVISQYSVSQTVFDAALQSTAKIMQSSLANYI